MFELEPPKAPRTTDWFGTILGVAMSPIFFFFASVGKPDFGLTAYIITGVFVFAVRTRWALRRHAWFWVMVACLALLHIRLLFALQWPHGNFPAIVYTVPIGIADFLVILGAIDLGKRLFLRDTGQEVDR